MLKGACHCGAVSWVFDGMPASATACNCTVCRRYAALWAYDYEDGIISYQGQTRAYVRGRAIEFHFCPDCGCIAFWRGRNLDGQGRRRVAVNLRLAEPDAIADLPIDHFDGLDSFDDLPRDHRRIRDMWF
jgi:hypothetical protein